MKSFLRFFFLLTAAACTEQSVAPVDVDITSQPAPPGINVSNAILGNTGSLNIAGTPVLAAEPDSVVFISIEPGTFVGASLVTVVNRRTGASAVAAVDSGGVDPLSIRAHTGDDIKISITGIGNLAPLYVKVPPRKPPVVVRTIPQKGRIDVALNALIRVIFSEPVDPSTVTSNTLRLLTGAQPVEGSITFDKDRTVVVFTPSSDLAVGTTYNIDVQSKIADINGEKLASNYSSDFTTCPGYAIPSQCPPFPTGGSSSISGTVRGWTDDGLKPVGSATVWAWIQQAGFGYARGATPADENGRFTITLLPNDGGLLQLFASAPDFLQACGRLTSTTAQTTTDIEMISPGHQPDASMGLPRVSGVVYETINGVRTPVENAWVVLDTAMGMGLIAAETFTGADGKYALCRIHSLGMGQVIQGYKEGYEIAEKSINLVNDEDSPLDLELKR